MKIELRWVIMLICLTFGIVLSVSFGAFYIGDIHTNDMRIFLPYIPVAVAFAYAIGVDMGLQKKEVIMNQDTEDCICLLVGMGIGVFLTLVFQSVVM